VYFCVVFKYTHMKILKYCLFLSGIQFFMVASGFAQQDYATKYFNEGIKEFNRNNCAKADTLFMNSARILPHRDTFYNLALVKNCLNDMDGFCYYLALASDLGDTVSLRLIRKHCSDYIQEGDKEKYNTKSNYVTLYEDQEVFTICETQPQYPGGEQRLMEFLAANIVYPPDAKTNGIQGTIFATFIVETDGIISNIRILRGIGGGCDEEVIRVLLKMPRWIPGTQKGVAVRVQFNLPVRFVLQDGTTMNKSEEIYEYSEGWKAYLFGDCAKADSLFSHTIASKKQKKITASDYYGLAHSKKCLNDTAAYCYNLYLAIGLGDGNSEALYKLDCAGFDPQKYIEHLKVLKTVEAQQSTSGCPEVFTVVDEQPIFPGDLAAMNQFIYSNLVYPKAAAKDKISGKVYLSVVISQEGKIENVSVLKGIGSGCDEEAQRIVEAMPEWTPGKLNQEYVCTRINIVIRFDPGE
jgi:TonB family protein